MDFCKAIYKRERKTPCIYVYMYKTLVYCCFFFFVQWCRDTDSHRLTDTFARFHLWFHMRSVFIFSSFYDLSLFLFNSLYFDSVRVRHVYYIFHALHFAFSVDIDTLVYCRVTCCCLLFGFLKMHILWRYVWSNQKPPIRLSNLIETIFAMLQCILLFFFTQFFFRLSVCKSFTLSFLFRTNE